jgi:hypothetical protein
MVPAKFVKPYVKSNKNDIIDAEAIVEAVTRPTMRFVEVRSSGQIDLQALSIVVTAPVMSEPCTRTTRWDWPANYGSSLTSASMPRRLLFSVGVGAIDLAQTSPARSVLSFPTAADTSPTDLTRESIMRFIAIMREAGLAAIVASGVTTAVTAQTAEADPHHPNTTGTSASPSPRPGDKAGEDHSAPAGEPRITPPGMMGQEMMGQMMRPGMMGSGRMMQMPVHMMKIMFAIADTDGDSALSFEEIAAIHKRIFDKVDVNKDGKVTPEEIQVFMRD